MEEPPVLFSKLELTGWRQFKSVKLDLHPRLTILTGANACGKTTIIGMFARHFGYPNRFLATPTIDDSGSVTFSFGLFLSLARRLIVRRHPILKNRVGAVTYSSGEESIITVPETTSGPQFQLNFSAAKSVAGLNIPSHRQLPNYQPVTNIPINAMIPEAAYSSYLGEWFARNEGGHTGYSPIYRMKEALISMATFGPGNLRIKRNEQADRALAGFESVLKKMLPKTLGFIGINIRQADVVLDTETGEFLLDASSGGLMALIDICWQIYLYSLSHSQFVVTMDEPENHLHPAMQRSLMGDLIATFPTAQFIVATHSPFIVSSVKNSAVYALRYDASSARKRIVSEQLDIGKKAGTASEVLREVLGVPVTAPEWVETALQQIVKRYSDGPISQKRLTELKAELIEAGLEDYFSDALAGLAVPHDISSQIR
jgi:hypothetical protein